MDRTQQIKFCRVCELSNFTIERGIICSLTNDKAVFESTCPDFTLKEGQVSPYNSDNDDFITPEKEKRKRESFTNNDLWLMLSVVLGVTFFIRLNAYSELMGYKLRNFCWLFVLFNGNTISLVLRKRTNYRFRFLGDLNFRLIIAIGISLLNAVYLVITSSHDGWFVVLFCSLLLISSFFISFLSSLAAMPIARLIFKKRQSDEDEVF